MNTKHTLLLTSALIGSLVVSGSALAQVGDEIIVSATKRETTLKDTPIAVSVTPVEVIEEAKILDILDLQSVIPTLRVGQFQNSFNTSFAIRGFGNGSNDAGIEPAVGVFIDGVYRSRSAARIGDLPKLERIEVLSGPQSTLFGKNASAGVISIVSASPSYETEGYAEIGIGNYDQRTAKAYVSTGLSDTVAVSLGGSWNKRDGYAKSFNPNLNAVNSRDRWSIRGQALFEPKDNISLRIIADYSELDEICCDVTNVVNDPVRSSIISGLGGTLADPNDPFAFVSYLDADPINLSEDRGISAHLDVDFDNFTLTSISSLRKNDAYYRSDVDYTSAQIVDADQDTGIKTFTQELRLTSTTDSALQWMIGGYYFNEDITQDSGLQYGTQIRPYFDILSGGALDLIEAANGFAPGSFFNADTTTEEYFTQDDEAYSIFGTVDFSVSDRLTLTGGLNYTNDKKQVTGRDIVNDTIGDQFSQLDLAGTAGFNSLVLSQLLTNFPALAGAFGRTGADAAYNPTNVGAILGLPGGAAAFGGLQSAILNGVGALDLSDPAQNPLLGLQAFQFQPAFLAFPNSVEDGKSADDKLTWTLRGAYELNDNINLYASAATGFKSTSWNLERGSRPFSTDQAALISANLTRANQGYGTRLAGPETARVFEIGAKGSFEKGAFNLAVFDQRIKGFQASTFIGASFVLSNAGIQRTRGLEFDATYTPIEPLTLTFATTILDPIYIEYLEAPSLTPGQSQDLSGTDVPGIPKFSFATSATYNHNFENGMSGFLRADYQHESTNRINYAFPFERSVGTVNASMGLSLQNDLSVQLWARNLFNDQYYLALFPGVIQATTVNGYANQPRTYGLSLRKEF